MRSQWADAASLSSADPDPHPFSLKVRQDAQAGLPGPDRDLANKAVAAMYPQWRFGPWFDKKRDLADLKRFRRRDCKILGKNWLQMVGSITVDCAREADMEAKFVHHIGIAPSAQIIFLSWRQPATASARKFLAVGCAAKAIKHLDALCRELMEGRRRRLQGQRQKIRKSGDAERRRAKTRLYLGERRQALFKVG
jgi:hypothetical protein